MNGRAKQKMFISEASKGGMKVGRIKDPLYKDYYSGITFIPPFEASDHCTRPGAFHGPSRARVPGRDGARGLRARAARMASRTANRF